MPILILPELAKSRHMKQARRIATTMHHESPTVPTVVCHLIQREDDTQDPIQAAWDRDDAAVCAFLTGVL